MRTVQPLDLAVDDVLESIGGDDTVAGDRVLAVTLCHDAYDRCSWVEIDTGAGSVLSVGTDVEVVIR